MPFKIQEIVFILPVAAFQIPGVYNSPSPRVLPSWPVAAFQNSRCLRLVGEYPVIPFQIQGICSLKDENGNVVFPVAAFQIPGVYNFART